MTVSAALEQVREAPRLTIAMRKAVVLTAAAARSVDPLEDAKRLCNAIERDDPVVATAAVHALGAIANPFANDVLLELLRRGDQPLVSHAAWVFGARMPSPAAIPLLVELVSAGGFTAMLAERTLIEWTRLCPDEMCGGLLPQEFWPQTVRPTSDRSHLSHLNRSHSGDGIVIVQPFLHARLDGSGSWLGAGDGGGIASLLRSLGNSLAVLDAVDEVITITRAEPLDNGGHAPLSGYLSDKHRIERIPYGTLPTVPWREAWQFRTLLEREMFAIGQALHGRRVVWHLRMADVGTLAASAVARRLGHRVVFTAAPDPHVVIDALQADGRLDRARFGIEDTACQYWFRARMVERLSELVDHIALLPRPTLHQELVELVGLDPLDLHTRSTVVAEGVDVHAIDEALSRSAGLAIQNKALVGRGSAAANTPSVAPVVATVLAGLPRQRQGLPWILAVGRLNPLKGLHRIVAALAMHKHIAASFNLVIVGGDLSDPSPDEQSTLDQISHAGAALADGVVTLLGHRPPQEICDLLVHGAQTNSVYVCASDKEEFGLAIVEALAAGMVVVAPQRGGPITYIANGCNGVLCDTSSVAALANAIGRAAVMADDDVRRTNARAQVRNELSIEAMAQRLSTIYETLVPAEIGVA